MTRTFQRPLKRIVVKLGSSQIADSNMQPKREGLFALVEQIKELQHRKIDVVLVSSGAIALGMGELGEKKRPTQLTALQARAAIGQTVLMHTYRELFKKVDLKCAQVLLAWDDFDNHGRYLNAKHTLNAILEKGVVPVINENDTTSTEEIKFGDNDKLSALVASLIDAELLVILSDVEGFYNQNKEVVKEIAEISSTIKSLAQGTRNKHLARGGMITKLDAIQIAGESKIPCVIASGHKNNVLVRLVDGERLGTLFIEKEKKITAHKHWIAFVGTAKGTLYVDEGAKKALLEGKSLLLPGIKDFDGHFKAGDVVSVADTLKEVFARGEISYSTSDLLKVNDKKGKHEVIHRDYLVLVGD